MMLCPVCKNEIRQNKGWAATIYDGYCNHCDMPVEKGEPNPEEMQCNPDICPNCEYICDGDSYCHAIGEFVLSDWEPTIYYDSNECPFKSRKPAKEKNNRRNRRRRQ